MRCSETIDTSIDRRIARRLRELRAARGWSLDALAAASGVSRATLSRIENGETSPTAAVLGRLAAAHGITLSRLVHLAEDGFPPRLPRDAQPVWTDPETGFVRRTVSPPAADLAGEVVEGALPAGLRIAYPAPPRPGLEHHLAMMDGQLAVTLGPVTHRLSAGDCLRYRLDGPSAFETPPDAAARYLLFIV